MFALARLETDIFAVSGMPIARGACSLSVGTAVRSVSSGSAGRLTGTEMLLKNPLKLYDRDLSEAVSTLASAASGSLSRSSVTSISSDISKLRVSAACCEITPGEAPATKRPRYTPSAARKMMEF